MSAAQIAQQLGRSYPSIRRWINSEQASRDRASNSRRQKNCSADHCAQQARFRVRSKYGHDETLVDRDRELAIFAEAQRLTQQTGVPHDVDHIKPLSIGGPHVWWNLRTIPAALNRRKHDTFNPADQALFALLQSQHGFQS